MEKPGKHDLHQAIKVNITSDKLCGYHVPPDEMWQEGHFTSVVFFPKAHNPSLDMRKSSAKPQLKNILQNTWPALLKTVKVMGDKQILRNYHRAN